MSVFSKLPVAGLVAGSLIALSGSLSAHEGTQTTTVRWGPVELPAATEDGPGEAHNEIAGLEGFRASIIDGVTSAAGYEVEKPCEDCYIVAIEPNLVLENGETANFNNGFMLHHVVNVNFSEPDVTCRPNLFSFKPIKALGGLAGGNQRIFASGNERTGGHMDGPYGYYVSEGDDWGLIYHLMNMNPEPRDVYFEYEFKWVDASESDLRPVRPLWMDIDQCGDSEADSPAGYSDLTWAWKSDRTHTFTNAGGHIHNYGINVAWTNQTKGELVCNSVAGYAAGSPYMPIGPGTGADPAHPVEAMVVDSDPLGLENYQGNISDMTVCNFGEEGPRVDRRDEMMFNAQVYRPEANDHEMGIMVSFIEEEFCLTDFWCF